MGNVVGYVRVSTEEQSADLQIDALQAAGASKVFQDIGVSGVKTERPGLQALLDYLRPGDTLTVWRLDRLGRSMPHLTQLVSELRDKGIHFRSLTEGIDTSSINGELIFNIFASLAQFERQLIQERTRAGLASAKARGRLGGRPSLLGTEKIARAKALHKAGQMTNTEIAQALGVSVATLYRYLAK
jgi:DNA invertase Pin-like site-specific DNA recombinase